MSIRYECDECGSVFKIKDSLAGTKGKCPTCQKKFIVPQKGQDSGIDLEGGRDSHIEKGTPPPQETAPFAPPSESGRNGSFLPEGESSPGEAPNQTKSGPETSPPPAPTTPSKSSPALPSTSPPPLAAEAAPAAGEPESPAGDDFDVDSFLMDQEAAAQAKASAGLTTSPSPAASEKPQYDKQGRRLLGAALARPGSPSGSPAASAAAEAVDAALEGGQVKAGPIQIPPPRRRLISFTFAGTLPLLRKRALWILLGAAIVAGGSVLSLRWQTVQFNRPVLSAVSGKVTLDGRPLAGVTVHLTPVFPHDGKDTRGQPIRLRDSIGITDEEGLYSVQYIDGLDGAPLGNVRIWIETIQPAHLKTVPAGYLTNNSTDIRAVKEAGNDTRFDLQMTSPAQQ